MAKSSFVYVIYIRTTPDRLWQALIEPAFTRQYWLGAYQESEWKQGASWKLFLEDGRLADAGEILEIDPHKRIVIRWRNEFLPEFKAEGYTRCTIEIEQTGETTKLAISHVAEADGPHKLIDEGVSNGWPMILAGLKSLLETGRALPAADLRPKG